LSSTGNTFSLPMALASANLVDFSLVPSPGTPGEDSGQGAYYPR
jgi:hypothetical protein